ncbi:hypothetical protein [Cognatishimia sp. F0-27]|uniref:hypothetical protein n=1 Tax=Cognatishimia sp. F0-27 TaxID=2816855 RepID=UPI001D0C936A|nr:hypothetical protein [Cognatishimia sp. F0-27]MCC1491680.1 hypothetical protein [Cognatishimia sp. F0-27]
MARILLSAVSIVILGIISLGAQDYISQAVRAGLAPGEFGLAGWTKSFVERGRAAARRAEQELRRDGDMRDYLPEAPSGWVRVDWAPEYRAALRPEPRHRTPDEDRILEEINQVPVIQAVRAVSGAKHALLGADTKTDRWVYTRGDSVIIAELRFLRDKPASGIGGLAAQIGSFDSPRITRQSRIFEVNGGHAFRLIRGTGKPGVLRMRAVIGDEIRLTLTGNATRPDFKRLIASVDMQALAALTSNPAASSGGDREQLAEMRRREQQLRREQNQQRRKEIEERESIERRLQSMAQRARGSGKSEVCLSHRGKEYCAWVY